MSTPHTFGFAARYTPAYYDGDEQGWEIKLPHQCDSWAIHASSDYDGPVPRAVAVERLRQFIAEAQHILAQIEQAPTFPAAEISFGRDDI